MSVTFHVLTWVAAMAASSVNSPTAAQNGSMTCPNAMVSALAPPSRWLLHALSDSTLNAGDVSSVAIQLTLAASRSPTYPSSISSFSRAYMGDERAWMPTIVRTPFSRARAAICWASARSLPKGHSV